MLINHLGIKLWKWLRNSEAVNIQIYYLVLSNVLEIKVLLLNFRFPYVLT